MALATRVRVVHTPSRNEFRWRANPPEDSQGVFEINRAPASFISYIYKLMHAERTVLEANGRGMVLRGCVLRCVAARDA